MTEFPMRRILLVEDTPSESRTMLRRLRKEGYDVALAEDYETAKRWLEAERFHAAIIDLCLDFSRGKNDEGLLLLKAIKDAGMETILPAIVVTAYSTEDKVLKALQEHGAAGYIRKKPGYIAKVLEKIKMLFENKIGINFGLQYLGNSIQQIKQCAAHIHEAEDHWPAPDVLTPQVHDLIGKMFLNASSLLLTPMAPGLSGSVVMRADPTFPNGLGQSVVVKIGRRDKTEVEEKNYRDHVKLYLPINHVTQLDATYTRHLGGLLYTLNLPDVGNAKDLTNFYHSKSATEIVSALDRLFRETCARWYRNRTFPTMENLRDLYLGAFYLQDQPDRIPHEVNDLRPGTTHAQPTIPFPALGIELPNPLIWLVDDAAGWMAVSRCITHGDLNANNILMNEAGQCWLIDFYRTYPSHILRDLVVLETDIKFRLMDSLTPEAFSELEHALVHLQPNEEFRPTLMMPVHARKAGEVIAGLRVQAWRLLDAGLVGNGHLAREYLSSLLMATLNVLRLRHFKTDPALQPRRELALLSACLICQRLEELRSQ